MFLPLMKIAQYRGAETDIHPCLLSKPDVIKLSASPFVFCPWGKKTEEGGQKKLEKNRRLIDRLPLLNFSLPNLL